MSEIDFVREKLQPCFPKAPQNEVNCIFIVAITGYTCFVQNFNWETDTFVPGENHVPGKSNTDVEVIRLMSSVLDAIPENIFTDFPNLKELTLIGTTVDSYQEIQFCDKLERIYLNSNNLTAIPNQLFKKCGNLNYFSAGSNKIQRVPCRLFSQNPNLRTIDFSFNQINAVEPCFMSDLKSLNGINFLSNLCVFENFVIRSEEDLKRIESRMKNCFANWS